MASPWKAEKPNDSIMATRAFALEWHGEQVDKAGNPYSDHLDGTARNVVSLFPNLTPFTQNDAVKAAYLHDVLEDTECTVDDLLEAGFSPDVVASVELLTHTPNTPRRDYLEMILGDSSAIPAIVKIADMRNNLGRLWQVDDEATKDRLREKYQSGLWLLESAMSPAMQRYTGYKLFIGKRVKDTDLVEYADGGVEYVTFGL